jgi:hypothetical protein
MTGAATGSTPTTLTLDNIQIVWTPTLEQFITTGTSLIDPASKGFKIFFGGITPAIDDAANRESVVLTPSGTTAQVSFTTADGQALSQAFARTSAVGAGNIALQDAGQYALHLVENETVAINEYVVLGQNSLANSSQNPFGHIIRVLSLQTASTSTSTLQDVASGATLTITGGDTTLYLDGQPYYVNVLNSTHAKFTWGTNAANNNVGDAFDVYPAIMTSKGSWVAITYPVTISGLTKYTNYAFNLPTGTVTINCSQGTFGNTTVGTAKFEIVNASTTSITIRATDNQATQTQWTTPGILVVEGLDENTVRNLIAVRVDSGASYNRAEIAAAPAFTGTTTTVSSVS